MISLAVLHGLLVDIFGWHFDITHPAAYLAHTLGNVPMPKHAAAAKGSEAAAASSRVTAPVDHSARRRVVESKKGR